MAFKNLIFTEIPRLVRNVKIRINTIASEIVEFLKHDVIVLFDHHLALLDKLARVIANDLRNI